MIKVYIQGKKDGKYDYHQEASVEDVPGLLPEFYGKITISGILRKFGSRYYLVGTASCMAKLTCGLTLKLFDEELTAEIKLAFIADNEMLFSSELKEENEFEQNVIREDDKEIDITDEIRELLALAIPMKNVAPEYRDIDFGDIYPEYAPKKEKKKEKIDDRWSELKKIKINNN